MAKINKKYQIIKDLNTIDTKINESKESIIETINDKGFLTSIPSEYITETELTAKGYLTEHQDLSNYATTTELENKVTDIQNEINKFANIVTIKTKVNSFEIGKTEGTLLSVSLSSFPSNREELIVNLELDNEDFKLSKDKLIFTKNNYTYYQDIVISYRGESYSTGSCFSTLVLSGECCLLKEIELKIVDNGITLIHKEEYNKSPSFLKWNQTDSSNMVVNKIGIRDLDIQLTEKGKSPLISNLNGFKEGEEYVILFEDITPDINILLLNADWSRQTHIDCANITSPHVFKAEFDYTQINFNPKTPTAHIYTHGFHIVPKEYYDTLNITNHNLIQYLDARENGVIEDNDNTIVTEVLPSFADTKWQGLGGDNTVSTSEFDFSMNWSTGQQAPLISNLKNFRMDKEYTITFDDIQKDMYIFVINSDWSQKMIIDCNTISSPYTFTPDRDDYTQVSFNPKVTGTNLYATNFHMKYNAPKVISKLIDKSGNGNDLVLDTDFIESDFKDAYLYTSAKGVGKKTDLILNGSNNITLTFGCRINVLPTEAPLIKLGNNFKVTLKNNRVEVYINNSELGLAANDTIKNITIGDNLEVTIVINNKIFKLYLDGKLAIEKSLNSSVSLNDGIILFGDTSNYIDMLFKYFMLYNVALTEEEIQNNYITNNAGFVYTEDYHTLADDIYSTLIVDNPKNFDAGKFKKHDLVFFVDKNSYFLNKNGDDTNDGLTRNTPIKTFARYKEIIKENSFEKSTLFIENGAYEFTEAFELLDGNFGDSCEVTLKAIGNNVVFTSGEQLDNSLFNKISLNGRDDVYEYDLSSIDIDFSYDSTNANTFEKAPFITYGDDRMFIASYPKGDMWAKSVENQATAVGNGFKFTVKDKDVITLTDLTNVIADTFASTPYSNYFEYIASYEDKVLTTSTNFKGINIQPYTGGIMYRIINSKELLTEKGEYFIDYTNKKLYLIPPDNGIKYTTIRLIHRNLNAYFINNNTTAEYSEYYKGAKVNFDRITFDGFRNNIFSGCLSHVHFNDCRFINCGGDAISPTNTHYMTVDNCRFKNNSGISIRLQNPTNGEVRQKLLDSNIKIRNCVFKNGGYCHSFFGYQFAIQIEAIGAKVERCCFDHYPGIVIRYQQNNNIIEKSLFRNSCYILMDTGCIYTGRDILARGNKVIGNILYGNETYHGEDSNYGATGLYLDDMASGNILINNITVGFKHGVQIGGGRDNIISNNIFENATVPYWTDARGTSWMQLNQPYWAIDVLNEAWLGDIWTAQYPGVEQVPTRDNLITTNSVDNEHALPRGNKIYNNTNLNPKSNQLFNNVFVSLTDFDGNKTV